MAFRHATKRTIRPDSQRKRVKDRRKLQLIEAAITIIAKHGLTQTTIANVSSEAGMSRGIINFYFTSKESMLKEALATLFSAERQAVQECLGKNAERSPQVRLAALMEVLSSPKRYNKKRLAAWCAFAAFAASHAPTRYAFEQNYQEITTVLTELCREAGAASPVHSAALLMTYIQGARFNEVTGVAHLSKEDVFAQLRLFEIKIPAAAPDNKVVAITDAQKTKAPKKKSSASDEHLVVADLFANL